MIKIKDLEKIYRTEEVETIALNKLSMEVKEGEFVAVMGPSGCGKSTLLNILGLLDDSDSGSFIFNGVEVVDFNERKRAEMRKHNIGFRCALSMCDIASPPDAGPTEHLVDDLESANPLSDSPSIDNQSTSELVESQAPEEMPA